MADPMSPQRREQQISIVTHDLESTLCSSATKISTSIDSPDSDQSPGLPSELVRRSNSLRSRPIVASRPMSPTETMSLQCPMSKPESPDVVVLCLWPHATASQISFYTTGYIDLYPSAQVLAYRSSWTTDHRNRNEILDVLTTTSSEKAYLNEKDPSTTTPSVLLHLFGHPGAQNATSLLRAYRTRTQSPMKVRAIISDAEPSFSLTLPTTLAQSLTFFHHLLLALLTLLSSLLNVFEPHTNSSTRIRDDLADPLLVPEGVRRGFVFAERNLMFSWDDRAVKSASLDDDEDDDEAVERRDYSVKRDCVDVRGRLTGDQERYWLGVEGVWEGGSG